jgi:hypothetical protein
MQAMIEQRKDSRSDVSWPVSVFIVLPITSPVRTGRIVEVNFPRTESLAKEKGQFARVKTGRIVRVDRTTLFENAEIGVGISFV